MEKQYENIENLKHLIDFAIKKKAQLNSASLRYYQKVKDTPEYKEKRKKWNKEQHLKRKEKKKIQQQEEEATKRTQSIVT